MGGMAEPTAQTVTLMEAAARMRVAGHKWADVSEALGRIEDTCKHWVQTYPNHWSRAMRAAIDDALEIYENEALLICRRHLRSGEHRGPDGQMDPERSRLAQMAARDLLRHCRELHGTKMKLEHTGSEGGPIRLFLEMSDDELDELLED